MAEVGMELAYSTDTKPADEMETVTRTESLVEKGCQTQECQSKKLLQLQPVPEIPASQVDVASASASEKTPKVYETSTTVLSLQSASEGNSPFIREKVMEDGYNWRKYGQKLVKGNEFVRSYYRCTHPNCKSKKQLERSPGGQIVDTLYFAQHDHPKPLAGALPVNQDKRSDVFTAMSKEKLPGSTVRQTEPPKVHGGFHVSADDARTAISQSTRIKGDNTHKDANRPSSKRRKKGGTIEHVPMERSTNESRIVVRTQTLFDIVNDGYRWRKYGQKSVKGSPYPRSYYRCSSSGCPVKKHVERSFHDSKLLITTYEGEHDHGMPPGRIVTHNNMLDLEEVDDKVQGDVNKTPQSSALQVIITKDQQGEDDSRKETTKTNGFEKSLDQGPVSDGKSKEQIKDQATNHAKSDDKTNVETEPAQS